MAVTLFGLRGGTIFRHDELMALFSQPMPFPWLYKFKERIEQRFNVRVACIEHEFIKRIPRHNFSVYMYSKADYKAMAVFDGYISDINEPVLNEILSDIFSEEKLLRLILSKLRIFTVSLNAQPLKN